MGSYVTLRSLTERSEGDISPTFHRMAEYLRDSGEQARIQFQISGRENAVWTLELEGGDCRVASAQTREPALEIITAPETWLQIAEGSLSPISAFFGGKMRLRGDVELGKRLLRRLASTEGALDID